MMNLSLSAFQGLSDYTETWQKQKFHSKTNLDTKRPFIRCVIRLELIWLVVVWLVGWRRHLCGIVIGGRQIKFTPMKI